MIIQQNFAVFWKMKQNENNLTVVYRIKNVYKQNIANFIVLSLVNKNKIYKIFQSIDFVNDRN